MVLALQVLLDEVRQQLLEQPRGVVEAALQDHHGERGHRAAVSHGEATLGLQRVDEGKHEGAAVQQLPKEAQGLLDVGRGLRGTRRLREWGGPTGDEEWAGKGGGLTSSSLSTGWASMPGKSTRTA